jgi:CheY-like chemotaxis protein/anti-sigma regulatory factor (Ser/Thr protein kinase)
MILAKSQNYRIRIEKLRHEFIIGDQVRLKQVLINILNNANKYTPAGGQIDFTVEELPSASPETAMIRFTIADTGIGIAKEKLKTIFDPFTREVNTSVNKVEGTGLGLTIVKSIVDAAGGTVEVDSKKEKGSKFIVTLPLRIQNEAEALARYNYLHGKKMLVVEQSDGYAEDVCRMLRQAGAESICTNSVKAAAKAAADNKEVYLVALIDREEDAADAVRTIREAAPQQAIILMVNNGKLMEREETALAAGVDGLLEKPLFRSVLYEKIIAVCNGEKAGVTSDKYLLGRRILVVDDVEINRMIAQMMLENAGAQVERAGNGQEAVEKFARSKPAYYDAILMDVMMPVMGGYEATKAIRAMSRPDAAKIPIIAMTANAFAEDVEKSRAAGMNGHINKPVESGDVKAALLGLL